MIYVGSDFSGVGAFDQALMRLKIPYKTVFACDMDKYARQTYIHNYGEPEYYPENVYGREIPAKSLDIYMTSPPCQAFSLAGKRKGEDDDRGILFYNSHEFIQKNKPRYFIFENVKGLLSDSAGRTFNVWIEHLGGKSVNGNPVIFPLDNSAPYHIYHRVLNAKNYGVPQNRERVFIIGIRDDVDNDFSFPKPLHLVKRLKDVLQPEVDEKYFLSEKSINQLLKNEGADHLQTDKIANTLRCGGGGSVSKKHSFDVIAIGNTNPSGNGMNGNVFDGNGICPTLTTNKGEGVKIAAIRGRNPENASDRTIGATTEQRLEINHTGTSNTLTSVQKDNVVVQLNPSRESGGKQPYKQNRIYDSEFLSPVLDTECGRPNYKIDYRIRRLTPREAFRLMDFPDTFDISKVSDSQAYKQAGNSIVVNVLCEIIKKLNL